MLNLALLLRVVNEGENVVVNQAVEEVNPSVEVGSSTCVTSQASPGCIQPYLVFYKLISLLLFYTASSDKELSKSLIDALPILFFCMYLVTSFTS